MEASISQFRDGLARFCNHIDSTSTALLQSLNRRPIPFDSASVSFVQCLNRRVSTATSDLNLLESMTFDTVSFEELLGHCNEVYKKNQIDIVELEDRLSDFGYVPGLDIGEPEEDTNDTESNTSTPLGLKNMMEDDSLPLAEQYVQVLVEAGDIGLLIWFLIVRLDDTLSLRNLGISDASLATIVSEGNNAIEMDQLYEPATDISAIEKDEQHGLKPLEDSVSFIDVHKEVYDSLPSFLKCLASWEDLVAAVEKMNLHLKQKIKNGNFFTQDDLSSLDLGPKTRSYLVLLMKMNHLVVETIDGLISYKVL